MHIRPLPRMHSPTMRAPPPRLNTLLWGELGVACNAGQAGNCQSGTSDGIDRPVRKSLLEGRHAGRRHEALFQLCAENPCRAAPGAAGHRSLQSRLSRRAALALRARPASIPTAAAFMRTARSSRRSGCLRPRAGRLPIFYCTQETRPNNRPAGAFSTRRQSLGMPRDNDDYDIYREFAPQATDIVIRKQRASVFNGTPLVSHLTMLGVNSLIVCGESTSGCVRASCVDAYSRASMSRWSRNARSTAPSSLTRSTCSICTTSMLTSCMWTRWWRISMKLPTHRARRYHNGRKIRRACPGKVDHPRGEVRGMGGGGEGWRVWA